MVPELFDLCFVELVFEGVQAKATSDPTALHIVGLGMVSTNLAVFRVVLLKTATVLGAYAYMVAMVHVDTN